MVNDIGFFTESTDFHNCFVGVAWYLTWQEVPATRDRSEVVKNS